MLFLKYVTRIITGLVYTNQEEVLYVIHQINRSVSYNGAALLTSLQNHFKKPGTNTNTNAVNTIPTHEPIKSIPGLIFLLRVFLHFISSFLSLSFFDYLFFDFVCLFYFICLFYFFTIESVWFS
jgi:hypothetical protein